MSISAIELTSPFPFGAFTRDYGGPKSSGHKGPKWYVECGMDLDAPIGAEVRAVFPGHVTRIDTTPSTDTTHEYGEKIFIRSKISASGTDYSDDKLGAFYTHINDKPKKVVEGAFVDRGDFLGKLFFPSATHLHLALVEIIGGGPGGTYMGLTIFPDILTMVSKTKTLVVTFQQNGSQPAVVVK
jgi:murein DD-endopeptidase MepM/ murein hydrolase activator NlpD